jgi:hypothetical protein
MAVTIVSPAPPQKKIIKLADMVNLGRDVEVAEGQFIRMHALTLQQMIELFLEAQDEFLPLYAAGLDGLSVETLAPFLLSSPVLVAKIIAIASDDAENFVTVQKHMPATVQLIALAEVWKASVPDAKKAQELLSEVTALLRTLQAKGKDLEVQQKASASPESNLSNAS